MSLKVFVTGAAGMLAAHLVPKLVQRGWSVRLSELNAQQKFGLSIQALDITDEAAVRAVIGESRPDWIINCAAYTAVDRAESERELCFRVNATGVRNLAQAARAVHCRMLHISTDYVFGGPLAKHPERPIDESETTNPCGIYGLSKEYGEELLSAVLPDDSLIVRTSWLHGVQEPNFIASILRLIEEREELKVVNDQIGSPTWAEWLAEILTLLIERDARGLLHACSKGGISWCDFARAIALQTGARTRILPQTTAELNRPAPRPPYSVLATGRLEQFLGVQCPDWESGVRDHLRWIGAI